MWIDKPPTEPGHYWAYENGRYSVVEVRLNEWDNEPEIFWPGYDVPDHPTMTDFGDTWWWWWQKLKPPAFNRKGTR